MFMQINRLFLGAGITGLLNLAALTIASPSYALNTDFTTWSTIGSVTSTTSTATIESGTTAAASVYTGGGPGSLEAFLNIPVSITASTSPLTPQILLMLMVLLMVRRSPILHLQMLVIF